MPQAFIHAKHVRVVPNDRVDAIDNSLQDTIDMLVDRIKKLEDDFNDHILLRQKLDETEKK